MVDRTRPDALTIDAARRECTAALASRWTSPGQAARVAEILRRFDGFAMAHGIDRLAAVDDGLVANFVNAPHDGVPVSIALRHLRRSALRLLFRSARQAGLDVGDPTLDLVLPPRSPLSTRPLGDDEITLGRSHAMWSLSDGRRAAAWALAEATCRTSELAHVTISDIDLDEATVWIHGGRTTYPRRGQLTEWGQAYLVRRVAELDGRSDARLVYNGQVRGESGQASACIAIADVLTRSGLAAEPDVRPASVAAWAGRQVLAETGRIDEVARRLGMFSLDRAARFIAWDWHDPEPPG